MEWLADWWPLVAAVLAAAAPLLHRELAKGKVSKNRLVSELLARLAFGAEHAVLATGQAYVDALKAGKADGKLTDAEKKEAKRQAMKVAKAYIGKNGWDILTGELGADAAETAVSAAIESAVKRSDSPDPS